MIVSAPHPVPRPLGLPARLLLGAFFIVGAIIAAPSGFGLAWFVPYAGAGALLAIRRPRTSIGWLLLALGWAFATGLFQPLRRRVQSIVDRRFNRSRVDAERAIGTFSERARDEVDLARLQGAVLATARSAVHPSLAGLWLRTDALVGR